MRKYNKRKTAIIYYRISKKAKNDIRMQRKVCLDFCKNQNIRIVKEYYDRGYSGRTKNRPELKKLLQEKKKPDYILVYKVDRLGRNVNHLNKIVQGFEDRKIKFVSATQNFDNSTPEGKFMLRMLMSLAEFESGMISNRIKDGIRASGRKNEK